MIAFSQACSYFKNINTELLGLSIDSNQSHLAWVFDIYCKTGVKIPFPIIADRSGEIGENLPFFSFGGFIKGIDAINILLYEIIAFLIIFAALYFILRAVLVVTGLIEKILKATVILSIPSKILGIFVGILESYVYIFIVLVILTLPIFNIPFVRESRMVNFMLDETPILSSLSSEMIDIYDNVYNIVINRKDKNNEEINTEITKLMIDKKVLTKESARKLVDRNKLHINNKEILE